MAKKDFGSVNTGRVYQQITDATAEPEQETTAAQEAQEESETQKARKTYTTEETQEAQMQMKTQGRKGIKAQRINMAFAPDTYLYVKVMAAARGQTITDFVNEIVRQSMEANAENFEKAKEFIDQFNHL